jgi:hypothetical protein
MIQTIAAVLCVSMAGLGACATENDPDTQDRTLEVEIDPTSTGDGSIVSNDGGIDCEPDCASDYDIGSVISLSAIPVLGSFFDTWGGDCAGKISPFLVSLDGDRFCSARFISGVLLVLQEVAGTGTGRVTGDSGISCGSGGTTCAATFQAGDSASLTATPDSGSVFGGWTGDCAAFGANLSIKLEMALDLNCGFTFDDGPDPGDVLTPRGSFTFDHRIEGMTVRTGWAYTAGFDQAPQGHTVDYTDPDNLTSGAGPEYSPCFGARSLAGYYSPLPQHMDYVVHATCTTVRQGSITPASGGFTQLEFYSFAPGDADPVPGTNLEVIADFEFGRLQVFDRDTTADPAVAVNLTTPLERSCPFSIEMSDSVAFVAGREGVVGTSTENCENWKGLWRVNLNSWTVDGFTPFGTKLRDLAYFNDMVYVTDFEEDRVHVINALTGAYDRFISVGDGPTDVVIEDVPGSLNDRMYVTNWNTNLVKVFDLSTDTELDSQSSGGVSPVTLALDGNVLLVMNFGDAANSIGAVLKAFTIQ